MIMLDDALILRVLELLPLCVRLKIESLSGLTDFVVSITKVRGGLKTSVPFGDCSHSWHLHATHLKWYTCLGFVLFYY